MFQVLEEAGWVLSLPPPILGALPMADWPFLSGTHREFDLLGPVGILEGVVRVLIGQAGRADGSDHHSAAVAPDGVLEQTRQFAIPVGHMGLAALEGSERVWREVAGLDRPRLGPRARRKDPWLRELDAVLEGTLGQCSFTFASARALRTLMRASSERLMLAPSRSRSPFAWVLDARSEPARSIRLILAT